jgi:opacity protein-like surface antigen
MHWTVLLRATAILPALTLLPAGALERPPVPAAAMIAPITLAEANGAGSTAQQAEPLPAETRPDAAPAKPVPSPWAGTLELYGFAPLRATTSVTRGATKRDLPRKLGRGRGDGLKDQVASRADGLTQGLRDLSFPDEIEIPGFTAVTDAGLGTILEHLTDSFYLRGSVEYNRIGFQTDLSYVGLGGQTSTTFQRSRRVFPDLPEPTRTLKTQVAITQGIYDFAFRYRFGERERAISTPGALTVIPYAGVRVLDLEVETTSTFAGPLVQRSRESSFGQPIAQPLLGLQGQVFLSPRLRLFARGDLGGFGSNGAVDMSGNAQAGVGYAIGNSTQLDLSWRYLYLARDNGDTPKSAYTIDQNGIEVGVKVFF